MVGAVQASGALAALRHEPRLAQDGEVLRHRRPRDLRERRRDVARRVLRAPDEAEDGAAAGFGDGPEGGVHAKRVSQDLR